MEQSIEVKNINVPNLIKTNQYFQFISLIKNYEDTLQKLFASSKESNIIKDPFVFLWKMQKSDGIFPDMKNNIDLSEFEITFTNLENIVVTGPFIRECFVNSSENKVRNEIYIYRFGAEKWEEILDISKFTEKKTEYIFDNDTHRIFLVKKRYKSPSHILLQHGYLKRVGWINGDLYVSSMFLIEIQKHLNLIKSNFKDPILNLPYDPLEIYRNQERDKTHPVKIIDMIDYEGITKMPVKNLNKLFNSKTCMELCLDRYMNEDHPVLLNELKKMIIYLSGFKYLRPPFIYAKILGFDTKFPDIYNLLVSIPNQYGITNVTAVPKTIDEINNEIIELIIWKDNVTNLMNYLSFSKQKIGKNIVNYVIKHGSKNISKFLISNNLLDNHLVYYLILMTENLELIKLLGQDFDMEIGVNYLKDILENGKVKSFYFLYDFDQTIISTTFDCGRNVLHQIKAIGNYVDLIDLIMKLNPSLIDIMDSNKETPIIFHSKNNPEILESLLKYDFDPTLFDSENNTFLHHLCKHNCIDALRYSLDKYPELVDMPNKKSETPAIICCQNSQEDMFYVLKSRGCDLNARDYYGNTCYHYICSKSLCIGMMIEDQPNSFGIKPSDYCKISTNYYNFTKE